MNLNEPKSHKSYIRRKRCLHESSRIIQNTIRAINSSIGRQMPDAELLEYATNLARKIEASCWSPRLKITDKEYQKKTEEKTQQLCDSLIRQNNLSIIQAPGCFNCNNFLNPLFNSPAPFIVQNSNYFQGNNFNPNTIYPNNLQQTPLFHQNGPKSNAIQLQPPSLIPQTQVNNNINNSLNNNFLNTTMENGNIVKSMTNVIKNDINATKFQLETNINQKTNNINQNKTSVNLNSTEMLQNPLNNEKIYPNISDFSAEEQEAPTSFDNSPDSDTSDLQFNQHEKFNNSQLQAQGTTSNVFNNFQGSLSPFTSNSPSMESFKDNSNQLPPKNPVKPSSKRKPRKQHQKSSFNTNQPNIKSINEQQQNPQQQFSLMQQQQMMLQAMQFKQQRQQMMQMQQQSEMQTFQQMNQVQQQQKQANIGRQAFNNQTMNFPNNSSSSSLQQQQQPQPFQQPMPISPMMQQSMDFSNNQSFNISSFSQQQTTQFPQMQQSASNSELYGIEGNQDDDDDQMVWSTSKQYKQYQFFDG